MTVRRLARLQKGREVTSENAFPSSSNFIMLPFSSLLLPACVTHKDLSFLLCLSGDRTTALLICSKDSS